MNEKLLQSIKQIDANENVEACTEVTIEQLNALAEYLFQVWQEGIEDKEFQDQQEIVQSLGDFVVRHFPVFTEGGGVTTIASGVSKQVNAFSRRIGLQKKLSESNPHTESFSILDVFWDRKRDQSIRKTDREIDQINNPPIVHLVSNVLKGVFTGRYREQVNQLKSYVGHERSFNIEQLKRLSSDRSNLKKRSIVRNISAESLPDYEGYRREISQLEEGNDCKVTMAIFAFLLVKVNQQLNLNLDICFAQIARYPHPIVKVVFPLVNGTQHRPSFYDVSALDREMNLDDKDVVKQYESYEARKTNRYSELPVNLEGLRRWDRLYLEWVNK